MAKKGNAPKHSSSQAMGKSPQDLDFWTFIEAVASKHQSLSRSLGISNVGSEKIYYSYDESPFSLLLDGEASLHILYGRAFSDWICGGQWSQMMKFLDTLFGALREYNVCPAIYLNGCHEPLRFKEWVKHQKHLKSNACKIFRHLHRRAVPPPKAWWIPPTGLRSVLRLGLVALNNPAFLSLEEHYLDIMDTLWRNNFSGLIGSHSDLMFFKPPRLFSARSMRLSSELDLISTEFNLDGIAKSLDINPNRFCLLGALLGNHILPQRDLRDFHARLAPELNSSASKNRGAHHQDKVFRGVLNFVRKLPSMEDHVKIGEEVFRCEASDPRIQRLKESVEYYARGSREGASASSGRMGGKGGHSKKKGEMHSVTKEGIQYSTPPEKNGCNKESTPSALSSPTKGGGGQLSNGHAEEENGEKTTTNGNASSEGEENTSTKELDLSLRSEDSSIKILPIPEEIRRIASERHRSGLMSPQIYQIIRYGEIKFPVILENMKSSAPEPDLPRIHEFYRPLRQSVYAILFNLHHHRFTHRQQKETRASLEASISSLNSQSNPPSQEVTEKLERLQKELKDLGQETSEEEPQVLIREWLPYNLYAKPFLVQGVEVPWGIPTVQRLWLGSSVEDKEKRIRAFMSCMRCDGIKPRLLQTGVIPAHLLFMACVLRYIMSSTPSPILRKPELDAFLLTSLKAGGAGMIHGGGPSAPQVDIFTTRGVQLASLFMEGVEMGLLANDVCGAPLPLQMTQPWAFFNGVLFHSLLRKAGAVRNIYELCGRNEDLVSRIEMMKAAIIPELMNLNEGGFRRRSPFGPHGTAGGRVLSKKKGLRGGGKSVSVVKAKKSSESKKANRSGGSGSSKAEKISPHKAKEVNGEALAH